MQRGQVSIDLTLTILVAMLFVQGMAILMDDVTESQQAISIRSQGRAILNEVARIYTLNEELSQSFTAGTGAEITSTVDITYSVPKLILIGERRALDCEINYAGNKLTMNFDFDDAGNIYGDAPEELAVAVTRETTTLNGTFPIKCGETVDVG
ncbi:MAG: hypothetical protein ABID38_00845 [Candidatus Diapherotrites archaeon]